MGCGATKSIGSRVEAYGEDGPTGEPNDTSGLASATYRVPQDSDSCYALPRGHLSRVLAWHARARLAVLAKLESAEATRWRALMRRSESADHHPNVHFQALKYAINLVENLPAPNPSYAADKRSVVRYLCEFNVKHAMDTDWGEDAPADVDRDEVLRWVEDAMVLVGDIGLQEYAAPLKYLLAFVDLWPDQRNNQEPGFKRLQTIALDKCCSRGLLVERSVYNVERLGYSLGLIGANDPPYKPRQDVDGGIHWGAMNYPVQYEIVWPGASGDFANESFGETWLPGFAYTVIFLLIAHTLDPLFQESVRKVVQECGGIHRAPEVKGNMRMWAKELTDHKDAPEPKVAENIDVIRAAAIFIPPSALRDAHRLFQSTPGFTLLRNKNGYHPDHPAAEAGYYRALLSNFKFVPHQDGTPLTWGQLHNEINVASTRLKNLYDEAELKEHGRIDGRQAWQKRLLEYAASYLKSDAMRHKTPCIVGEVQFILQPYFALRKYTHFYFKVARAGDSGGMVSDFLASLSADDSIH